MKRFAEAGVNFFATVFLCKVVLSLSRESTKERPGATMEVWPPDPSAHSCLACVEPSRGDLHSRVGGAGSAPPHDRSPAFGISKRLGKRRRWINVAGPRVAAHPPCAVTPAKEKPIFQYERWVSKGPSGPSWGFQRGNAPLVGESRGGSAPSGYLIFSRYSS